MKKGECIERYGEAEWDRRLEQQQEYREAHREELKARAKEYREEHPEETGDTVKKYREEHPEVVKANQQEQHRKGGKYYDHALEYNRTGLQGERHKIRKKHAHQYKPYKQIIAPESQIHHEWIPKTVEYRGIALVETEAHMHGFVKVIEILDGEITLLTEEEIRNND